ncbi:MAG TPA: ANTAR domain-containing protein [Cellulomonas sp.]
MRVQTADGSVRVDADASLDGLVQTLTTRAGRTLDVPAQVCATAVVRGVDRWLAASSVAVARCDGAQDVHRQGPRYLARERGDAVLVPDLREERRWPVWTRAAQVQGFASAAVVPGRHRDVAVHLALYSRDTLDWAAVVDRAAGLADGLAAVVSARDEVIALAQTVDDLLASSRSRPVIDRAIGVVMAQRGCDAAEAIAYLKQVSRHGDTQQFAADLVAAAGSRRPAALAAP